ncbi:MAG: hypothetical protein ACQETI_01765, partial [Halobacteriota archaeon]
MTDSSQPGTEYEALDAALNAGDAVAFAHVGDRFDDDLRYLTRFSAPDHEYAFVYVPGSGVTTEGRAILCAPASSTTR